MKKLFALALVVLGLAACQTDHSDLDVQFDGNATITLSIPADAVTRAGGSDSAASGLENTTGETLRFILAIYDETGTEKIRETKYAEEDILTANFPVRLVPGRSYTFVAWADMVTAEGADNHYNTSDLKNITLNVNSEWNAMDETRDAFTASKTIAAYSSTEDLNMQLTRPFAKVRVIATDVADIARLGLTAEKATVTYSGEIATSYNAFNQEVASTATRDEFTYEIANYGDSKDGKLVLYTDYIFANEEQGAVKFSLTTREESGREIKTVNFNTDIPVKRNMLTTLTGNVMTEGNNVSVVVEPVFPVDGGKHDITAISSYQDLLTAIEQGGEYLVINNIAVNAGASTSSLAATRTGEEAAGKTTTINLNGFTITVKNTSTDAAITIDAGNTLVITGEGNVTLTEDSKGAFIENNGEVVIENGNYQNNSNPTDNVSIIENNADATINVDGGDLGEGTLTNNGNANITGGEVQEGAISNEENASVTITGGEVDNNAIAGDGEVTNHVAELKKAFANGGEYTLTADVTLSETITLAADKILVLDLNEKTINGVNNVSDKNNDGRLDSHDNPILFSVAGDLTVKNGIVTYLHKGENYNWNACSETFYVHTNGKLTIENATIENLGGTDMAYAIDLVNAQENLYLTISDSHIKSTYIPVRVFNNGAGKNNVTIEDSTLAGVSRAFWVHVYSSKDNGGKGIKDTTLNLDIFGNGNTFIASNPNRIIEFGFDDVLNYDAEGNLVIYDAYRLQSLAKYVNGGKTFEGKTIKLVADIDLNNEEWTPIGSAYIDHGFMGNFDGNNKTIKNLKISEITPDTDGYVYAALFGVTEGTENQHNYIKNLTIENVNINTTGHIVAAAIAYPYYTDIENITVKGDINIKGGDYTSGVLAYTRRCVNAENLTISGNANSIIEGRHTIGGVISDIQMNGGLTANYSNFKASGLTIKGDKCVGGISGIIGLQTLDGATVENVTIVCDDVRKGQISGASDGDCRINNVTVNNIAGATFFVGSIYENGENNHTSVTINDVTYTYNDGWRNEAGEKIVADGVTIDSEDAYCIVSKSGMFWFANEVNVKSNAFTGKTVKLTANINLNNEAWTPVGQTGATTFKGVFDGQNYTISNLNINSEAQTGAHYSSGLFGWVETHSEGQGIIKNVKINNAAITGHHNCGALVGYITEKYAVVENCHVTNATISCTMANDDADGDKAGALIGNATVATIVKNCTAADSTVSAGRDSGQLIGAAKEANVTGCSATNVTVEANGTGTGNNIRNEVIGRLL